jgi:hypothetical protein
MPVKVVDVQPWLKELEDIEDRIKQELKLIQHMAGSIVLEKEKPSEDHERILIQYNFRMNLFFDSIKIYKADQEVLSAKINEVMYPFGVKVFYDDEYRNWYLDALYKSY